MYKIPKIETVAYLYIALGWQYLKYSVVYNKSSLFTRKYSVVYNKSFLFTSKYSLP